MYSSFLVAYQCFKLLEKENKRYLSTRDILNVYARKYRRLAPMFYIILFAGWSSCSHFIDAPVWPVMQRNWYNCGDVWWTKLLFIGNLYGFQEPAEGCYYWSWSIQCDMQLTLIVPFFV